MDRQCTSSLLALWAGVKEGQKSLKKSEENWNHFTNIIWTDEQDTEKNAENQERKSGLKLNGTMTQRIPLLIGMSWIMLNKMMRKGKGFLQQK